ncbi:hypothetical protein GGF50DRAFT_113627 [Schizophyllum commune]
MTIQSARVVLERAASVANIAMLRANDLPSQFQITGIHEPTSLLESELGCLPPNDISNRDRVLKQLAIHRAVLAPIRRLPIELLSDIFSRVLSLSQLRALHAATTLSHVCTTWREIACGHAALWTKMVVQTMVDFDKYCEPFLVKTRQVPLELRCDNRQILGDLWDRITQYASRWRRIPLEGHLSMLPDLKVLYMENLERLHVDAYGAPTSVDLSALDFVVAPRLRHVGLTLDALQSERQLHIPVARTLTSLEIDVMTPFPVTLTLPLLRACAATLQSLFLKVRYLLDGPEYSQPTSAPDTFEMSALTLLRLVDPACALLNHITAPHILVLILSNVPRVYGTRSLKGFLTRGRASHSLLALRVYKVEEREVSAGSLVSSS